VPPFFRALSTLLDTCSPRVAQPLVERPLRDRADGRNSQPAGAIPCSRLTWSSSRPSPEVWMSSPLCADAMAGSRADRWSPQPTVKSFPQGRWSQPSLSLPARARQGGALLYWRVSGRAAAAPDRRCGAVSKKARQRSMTAFTARRSSAHPEQTERRSTKSEGCLKSVLPAKRDGASTRPELLHPQANCWSVGGCVGPRFGL
jgi:hypothetical protein